MSASDGFGPGAVLFDRDGTLVEDVPYNGDPARVRPVAGARAALDMLRRNGVPLGVITNQSGVARGLITEEQVTAVHRRIEEVLGPFDVLRYCVHGPQDGCGCRKPAPGMVLAACARLGVRPKRTIVVGDIGADVAAATAAGATPILVPTPVTLAREVTAAPLVVADIGAAAVLALGLLQGVPA